MKLLEEIKKAYQNHVKKCDKEMESPRYNNAIKHTKKLVLNDYVDFIRSVSFATTRGKEIYDQFMCIRFHDMYLESAIGIYYLAEQGFINLAKRELRFLLEASLKHWYVDQEMMGDTFENKLSKYKDLVPNSSIDFVKDFKHYVLKDNVDFNAATKSVYRDLCSYVHCSHSQILDKVNRAKNKQFLGFTSAEELEKMNKLIFRTLELCIICQFNACGATTTGDLFIYDLDGDKSWKFHKSKFIQEVSTSYDYKLERQQNNEEKV